uniref:Lipoprotein n=1 Tax=Minutocellus polymorphus TaxID=265543 RepID=A0A6U4HP11_9STRA
MNRILPLLAIALSACPSAVTAGDEQPSRPEFSIYQARVKQHRQGARGDLVEGEEELRKIILGWHAIPSAAGYELCHQCVGRIEEATGVEMGDAEIGTVHATTLQDTCGGEPCLVMPGAPIGYNTFHLRYKTADNGIWSPWSEMKRYDVQDVGHLQHEEL